MGSPRRTWTEDDHRALAEGVELGLTSAEIARDLGHKPGTVRMYRTRLRRNAANKAPAPDPAAGRTRDCICCGGPFWSTGPGNRLCGACRNQSASPFDVDCAVHGGGA